MEIEVTNRPENLLDLGLCEVCSEPANTLTRDLKVLIRIDDPYSSEGTPFYGEHRFCELHRRGGTVAKVRESKDAYFARLTAIEGAEI